MRTSNPTLNNKVFERAQGYGADQAMSVSGTVNKTFILLALLVASASWVWGKIIQPMPELGYESAAQQTMANVGPFIWGGAIGGFILALVTIFKSQWAKITAPLYALCEGLFIGGISAIFELSYPGIVMQAVALTFGTLFCMLTAYRTGLVKVTQKFRMGVMAATGAVFLVYMVNFIVGFFGGSIPFLHGSSTMSIGISLLIVGIAALNLVLDFDLIDRLAAQGAPKHMEWYGGFALMVTLIWLYLEILRLLAKTRRR